MSRASAGASALLVAVSLICPPDAAAQQSNFTPTIEANSQAAAGWSVTPGISYSGAWDDNVLVRGEGDVPAADFLNTVNPRVSLDFNGRRGQLSATYDGAFLLYRELSTLNSYDQFGSLYGRRLLSPHVALFVRSYAASVPTTELVAFVGLPFIRNGSRIWDTQGGLEAHLSKRTTVSVSYDFQFVDFDHSSVGSEFLRGGHSQGVNGSVRHALDTRLALTADLQIAHALTHPPPIAGPLASPIDQTFDVQNLWTGLDYRLSEQMHVFGAGGFSRLGATELSRPRVGPAWRAGLARSFHKFAVDAEYSRSFVPAYGFGGTTQNEELSGHLRVPLARRVYSSGGVSWRRNDPLTDLDLPLRSVWIEAVVGYAATPAIHLEVFYSGTHQTIDRPGGETERNRIGFQVTTSKPMRVR